MSSTQHREHSQRRTHRAVSERRVPFERVALGSSLVVGGALFLKAAVAWYSIGLRGLILTKRVRIPVEVRPLPRAAQVTFAVNLGERRKP